MNPIDTLINTATSSMETTTGISFANLLSWGIDNLFKPFMGSGLAVLYTLRYWIVFVAVASILIYFGFIAFRFWRR